MTSNKRIITMSDVICFSQTINLPDCSSLSHWCHVFDCRDLFPEFFEKTVKAPRCVFIPYRVDNVTFKSR